MLSPEIPAETGQRYSKTSPLTVLLRQQVQTIRFVCQPSYSTAGLICGDKAVKKSLVSERSIVIAGHRTSVSLEDDFWKSLKEIAVERGMTTRSWSPQSMAIVNMPIYRQLFDFLCLTSIAISVAKASGGHSGDWGRPPL